MSEEKIWGLVLELSALGAIGALYYFWQRNRILKGPPDWQQDKMIELFHMGLECDHPELHPDLPEFLQAAEKKVASDDAVLDRKFIEEWKDRRLPSEMKVMLQNCHEWLDQSQPKTR